MEPHLMVALNRQPLIFDFIDDVAVQPDAPALSVARIDRGALISAEAFGPAVDAATPLPVGGLSKLIAALVVLRLAADQRLELDADVNAYLKRWRLPVNDYTLDRPVTLRLLLSHQSGIVDPAGSFGPLEGDPLPALVDVLAGRTRLHRGRVAVTMEPGREFSYSEAGYAVVQQAVEDATGLPFADVAAREVFAPLGLTSSFYPADDAGAALPAASGLWSSAADLARVMVSLGRSLEGDPAGLLPLAWAQETVYPRGPVEWAGLGLFVSPPGLGMTITAHGHGPGFAAMLAAAPRLGQGVVALSCGPVETPVRDIVRQVARAYYWPDRAAF
jgi:CubicO group peptidase (beta-lactamase class C family)